jgi:Secretion system C-terminal sorting domain
MYLGAFNGSSEFMNGTLDEVRVWNVARTQAQIQANMFSCPPLSITANLLMYYQFNHGAADAANSGINTMPNSANATTFPTSLNGFALTGSSSNWIRSTALGLPTTALSVTQNVSNNLFYDDCNLLAKVVPSGGSAVSGNVTVKEWVETTTKPFVRRHYEINPATSASTATGTITLYFTQADFDDYNANYAIKLPTEPTDAMGYKANVQVVKYAGTSAPNNDGLPASYSSTNTTFTPSSSNIVWNGYLWEITFNVTGFSGFFVKTGSAVLPVNLLSFEGKKLKNNTNLLTWHVAEEKDLKAYHVEKSIDGKTFEQVGIVKAKGSNSVYEFTDNNPNGGLSGVYYRLKMTDLDEKFEYSNIINLENDKIRKGVKIYPNPVSDILIVETDNVSDYQVINLLGQQVISGKAAQQIDVSALVQGAYLLRVGTEQVRFVKQ